MRDRLPLSALLSQALVAFTIEFDNEFEHLMPHRTTRHGASKDSPKNPWLVSMVMWLNCMRFLGEEGLSVSELERIARTKTNLNGMQRWGYLIVEPGNAGGKQKSSLIRETSKGRMAQEVWRAAFRRDRKTLGVSLW